MTIFGRHPELVSRTYFRKTQIITLSIVSEDLYFLFLAFGPIFFYKPTKYLALDSVQRDCLPLLMRSFFSSVFHLDHVDLKNNDDSFILVNTSET